MAWLVIERCLFFYAARRSSWESFPLGPLAEKASVSESHTLHLERFLTQRF